MKIDQNKCIGCFQCLPYCPLAAIKKNTNSDNLTAFIELDECVECGVCLRSGVCPTNAVYQQALEWPRTLRQAFSAVLYGYGALEEAGIYGYVATSGEAGVGGGRGTSEMKTNDTTGRYRDGEIGIGCEFGRPCVGFRFKDVEKITKPLAKAASEEIDVEFEHYNPLTLLLDTETGAIKYREILNERVMSAILEMKIDIDDVVKVIKLINENAKKLDTVITVDIINKCRGTEIPVLHLFEDAGFKIRINGKTNIGLGRPLADDS